MTIGHGEDLGHGVYVSPPENGRLAVISPRLDLGWKVAGGRVPGTAVVWHDQAFEVVARTGAGKGHRWVLQSWDDAGAMRNVVRLDAALVASTAERAASDRRGERNRVAALLLLPVLGLAPTTVQQRWQSEWLFPAELATWVSAALELLFGGVGLVQAMILAFGGGWFIPSPLKFLALVGPLMAVEAIVRLVLVVSRGEPVGSLVTLPLSLRARPSPPVSEATGPRVRLYDEENGVLELVSPINRTDWGHQGLLPFRERWFALDRANAEGRSWIYRFTIDDGGPGERPVLRLHPPPPMRFVAPRETSPPPSMLKTTLMTAAVTLGPRADQERWAGVLGVRPVWLTAASSTAELVGGLTNLGRDAAAGGTIFLLLDVYLILEGSFRLVSSLGGRPVGSIFGRILRPLYRQSLPPAR